MAFFNLTQLGAQDPFKLASASGASSPGVVNAQKTQDNVVATEALASPPLTTTDNRKPPLPSHSEMYSTSKTGTSHGGSYTQYTEMLNKHQRNTKGPAELYRRPVSTSHMYGWWMSEGEPLKQEWTQGERRVHVNSEMTRFVNEMSLTNKDFSLF